MRTERRAERGVALLLVLWVFMILGVLGLDFARYMRDDAMASVNLADETRGYYLALAGMNAAIFDAERRREQQNPGTPAGAAAAANNAMPHTLDDDDDGPLVPVDGQWHEGDFAGGRWAVRMVDEGGRISLNKADEVLLRRIFTNLLVPGGPTASIDRRTQNAIDTVVDSILDWRDHDSLRRAHGAESEYYLKRRVPYRAKNAFFDSPEELLLVRGITPQLFYGGEGVPGLRDVFSVYNRSAKISVVTAPAVVLQVLLGIDAAAAGELIEQRDAGVPIQDQVKAQLTSVDPALVVLIDDNVSAPHLVTISARGDLRAERNQSHVEVIADLAAPSTEGTRIIRWLDRAPWSGGLPGGGSPPAKDRS